jgi:hypothetical protein
LSVCAAGHGAQLASNVGCLLTIAAAIPELIRAHHSNGLQSQPFPVRHLFEMQLRGQHLATHLARLPQPDLGTSVTVRVRPSTFQLPTALHATQSGTLPPLALSLQAHAAHSLPAVKSCWRPTSTGSLVLGNLHAYPVKHVVDAAAGHSSSSPHPDTSNVTDQPSPAGLGPTVNSSNQVKGEVMPSVHTPSVQQQHQQHPMSGTPVPAFPWPCSNCHPWHAYFE